MRGNYGGKGYPPTLKSWKKGQTGNPNCIGTRGKLSTTEKVKLREIKRLTKKQVAEIGELVVMGNVEALQKVAADPNATVMQTMIAAVGARIIKKGDMAALDRLLDRLIGKVPDKIEHSGDLGVPPQVRITLPDNGRSSPVIDVTPGLPEPDDEFDLGF